MTLNYLMDENLAPAYRKQLFRLAPTLTTRMVGDPNAPPLGTLDPEILLWCEANNFVLITNNRRSMPLHLADHLAAGHHVPGIFTIDPEQGMAATMAELVLIAEAAFADEFQDRIEYLPL